MNKRNKCRHLKCNINNCDSLQLSLGLCSSHYKKQYRNKNRKKLLIQERIAAKNNRNKRLISLEKFRYSIKGRFGYMKRDAPRRGLVCTLTLEQYKSLINKACYYCENPLPRSMGTGLDRIDCKKGYTLDNVLTCCGNCNILRMNILTVEEHKIAVMAVKEFRNSKNAK